ncbi:MAG: Exosome complex component Rrp42 [Candidatus Argoarchaeum ethanivorans]|uniref:Exosome complex component Rrp42 n=1 Tax=Candidatus Argoarchaeum ethanivorans TaxID=2608793 RepID=A0A811T4K8_9EURY|nr:MAG: Exosome complex component Rrp42 [Candidatus Argoarchaeum ethanivorans]
MSEEVMNELKRDYLYSLILKNQRADGRDFEESRDIVIKTNIIEKAEGSASVKLGDTYLVAGIKIQPGTPFPDTPDKGVIITNLELIPMASPNFESGPPGENAVELARVVDRGIRESHSIDLKELCIVPGESVWLIFIDIHVIDDGGNLMDAACLAAIAALLGVTVPAKKYGIGEDFKLPVRDIPIAVTAVEIDGSIVVDPSIDEGRIAGAKLTVTSNIDGSISAMQKSGVGFFTPEQINYVADVAIKRSEELREKFLEL